MINWKQTTKELVFKTFLFKIFSVGFKSEKSGKEGKFDVLETKNWVNIIPVTRDNKIIMVKQFRFGISDVTLEFPAGAIESGQSSIEAAKRELVEETGGVCESIEEVGKCHPNPAFLSNTCYTFVARGVQITNALHLDEFEELEMVQVPINEVDSLIRDCKITNALSIVSWHFFKSQISK